MKITFLGTGTSQGVPVIACKCPVCYSADPKDRRLRSSVMVETGEIRIIIDCGPDFRQQMLREKVESIDAILLTHAHKDHLGGLDDVRAFNYILQRPADVYATRRVQQVIRKEYSYAFSANPYPGVPEINLHDFSIKPFEIHGQRVIPIKSLHYSPNQFVYGFRIGNLTYITDAVYISETEKNKIRGSDVVVVNALRKKKHYSHFCLDEAVALLSDMKPGMGFLSHISHQMGLHEEVNSQLPDFIKLAYDGLTVSF